MATPAFAVPALGEALYAVAVVAVEGVAAHLVQPLDPLG